MLFIEEDDPFFVRVYDLKIKTDRLLLSFLKGNAKTKTRGVGKDFNQIREYFLGDDVRLVDWRASAKIEHKLFLREYNEEKKYTILLAVDISLSLDCGDRDDKFELIWEIASIVTAACLFFHDQVALLLFTDELEWFIPFNTGRSHGFEIMKKLYNHKPRGKGTDISKALHFIGRLKKKDTIVFLISDFIDLNNYEKDLAVLSAKRDCIAIVCENKHEVHLPTFGFMTLMDPETKREILVDLRNEKCELNNYLKRYKREKKEAFKRCGVRYLFLPTKNFLYAELIVLFNREVRGILSPEWAYE